jgi:hypothetical protein
MCLFRLAGDTGETPTPVTSWIVSGVYLETFPEEGIPEGKRTFSESPNQRFHSSR